MNDDLKDALYVLVIGVGWVAIMTILFAIATALIR